MELDEIQDDKIISSLETELGISHPLTRADKFWNCICLFGFCLVICSAIVMIPASLIFIGFSSVDVIVEEAEKTLQERGIDALRSQISDLKIDPIKGSADVGAVSLEYKLNNFKIDSFYLNEEETTFEIHVGGITVDSKKDRVTILFDWEYEEKMFKIGDSGTAIATSNNLELLVSFKLDGTSAIRVTSCKLTLKDFDLDFDADGGASWLYDSAVKFFKSTVVTQIEEQVCEKLDGKKFEF